MTWSSMDNLGVPHLSRDVSYDGSSTVLQMVLIQSPLISQTKAKKKPLENQSAQ